jgi:hypothetical protein
MLHKKAAQTPGGVALIAIRFTATAGGHETLFASM